MPGDLRSDTGIDIADLRAWIPAEILDDESLKAVWLDAPERRRRGHIQSAHDIGVDEVASGDPAKGEVRVGCPEALAGVVSSMIDRMSKRHPKITVQVVPTEPAMMQLGGLRDRSVDLLVGRLFRPQVDNDIQTESLFEERYVVVAGSKNLWTSRRKIKLSELVNEPWVLLPESHFLMPRFLEAFRAKGVDAPRATVTTVSLHVRNHLLSTGRFIGLMSSSALRLDGRRWGIKELPIDLTVEVPPVAILTLKKRTLGPAAQLFIKYAKAMGAAEDSSH
jgi:DNA-binding transcriptional LysR family regulator